MNKYSLILILAVFSVLALSLVSAKTLIAGKIYNADFSETIADASVNVTCNSVNNLTTSLGDGTYAVTFSETDCNSSSTAEVYAWKGSLYGSSSGVVNDNVIMDWDIAIVNVPLIPEFGLIAGVVTVIASITIFFVVRRK